MNDRRIRSLERKLLSLNDERALLLEELSDHRDLADDAAQDAAVFDSPVDREAAYLTAADVARIEKLLSKNEHARERILKKLD
jgi:RNA polymerase-binding transcription factor DksA